MLVAVTLTELGYFERGTINLLVTDVGLPGINGRQLADAIRSRQTDLKVLFITGYAESAVLNHRHLESGTHIITKPLPLEALGYRVRPLLPDRD